jgi:hypothetical protein
MCAIIPSVADENRRLTIGPRYDSIPTALVLLSLSAHVEKTLDEAVAPRAPGASST